MSYIAQWGPMGFLVTPSKVVPFDNFSTSVSLKSDSGNDTSGTSATNNRSLELQPMSFSTKYMKALGVDPRERYEAWAALVGQAYPLYIGNKRFGPAKMLLTGVNVPELLTNNNGDFLSITIDITLEEESQGNTKKSSSSGSSSSGSSSSGSSSNKAASTYQKTADKKNAMNATASSSDRNAKKLSTKEKRLGR